MANNLHALDRDLYNRPQHVTGGHGATLMTDNGAVIDLGAGAGASCLGHGRHDLLKEARDSVMHVHSSQLRTQAPDLLAQNMALKTTWGAQGAVFWCSSGSEATEAAMKFAYQVQCARDRPQRFRFLSRRGAYHGNTLGALAISHIAGRRNRFEAILAPDIGCVSGQPLSAYYPFRESGDVSTDAYDQRLLNELEGRLLLNRGEVGAVVLEAISGTMMGCTPCSSKYLQGVRDLCDRFGALLIYDEVFCGTWRSGLRHGWSNSNVKPDMQTIGKAVAGGLVPLSGVILDGALVESMRLADGKTWHTQTFQAHPHACAVGLRVQTEVAAVLRHSTYLSPMTLEHHLRTALNGCPIIGDVRGRGWMWAIELVKDKRGLKPFDHKDEMMARVQKAALGCGVSVYGSTGCVDGVNGDLLIVCPPFNITEAETERACKALRDALNYVQKH